ncbi:butyrate kinase, partial [Lactiplantibacillus plantarum]
MVDRILSINPGATSTKIGYFEDDHLKLKKEFTYAYDEIIKYDSIIDQYNFRLKDIIHYLKNNRMG